MKRVYEYFLFGNYYIEEFTDEEKKEFENTHGTVCILINGESED